MSELNSLIGKTVAEVNETEDVMNPGVIIKFTDGTVLECSWYWQEGFYKIHFEDNAIHECKSNQIMPCIDRMYLQGTWYLFDKERNEYVKDDNQEP